MADDVLLPRTCPQAELKHARICMLAFAGYVSVDLGFRVPFAPEVSSLYAHDACVEKGPMLGLFVPLAVIEVFAGARSRPRIAQRSGGRRGGWSCRDVRGLAL